MSPLNGAAITARMPSGRVASIRLVLGAALAKTALVYVALR